jgi:putative ABC transport system permease protein
LLSPTLLRTGLRDLARRPLQTGLLVLGVALGVAVVIAIDLANEAARRGFGKSSEAIAGRATHQIRGGPSGVPEEVFRRLRSDWGFRRSTPVVEGVVLAPDLDRQPLTVLGVDPLTEGQFRTHLAAGAWASSGFARIFEERDAVLVGAGLADRYGLAPGRAFRLQVDDRFETVRVLGVLRGGAARDALDGVLLMDVGSAQELLGLAGSLSRIDLILGSEEVASVRARLTPDLRLVRASEQAETIGQLTSAFQLNLTALSLLALVVGMFLIYNTVMFSVVQRRTVIGTLRALGVTPAQVFALVLAETATAAAAGTALGLGLGYVLGQGAVRLVTRTINDLYYVVSVAGAPMSPSSVAKALVLGIGAALLSAVPPALEAAQVEPVAALRRSSLESGARRLLPRLALAGAGLGSVGAALLAFVPSSLIASFAGLFAVVLGMALLAPAATVGLMRLIGPLAGAGAGTLGRLAARTVTASIARTGVAIAALMVAVSVTIGVSLMIQSFRSTVENWLGQTLRADLYLAVPGSGSQRSRTLSAEVAGRLATLSGVADVEAFRAVVVASPEGPVQLNVADPRRERSAAVYRVSEGTPAETWARVEAGAVLASEPFAYRRHLPLHGGRVTLQTDRGPQVFPVAGVFYDYATERGTVLMARTVYERYWDDRKISSLAVYVAAGANPEDVAARLRAALAGTAIQVTPTGSLRKEALRIFDRTFAVTEALRLLAIVVAFVGVWSALMALQTERTRELATLLALGLTPARLWGLSLLETGFMGLAAGLLSLPTGALLAAILVEVINVRSFGWTMRLAFTPRIFLEALLVSVAAALVATVYPLVRLGRMPVAAALRSE